MDAQFGKPKAAKEEAGSGATHAFQQEQSSCQDYIDRDGVTNLVFACQGTLAEGLAKPLGIFQKHAVSILHIESRPSKQDPGGYELFVACDSAKGDLEKAVEELRASTKTLTVLTNKAPEESASSDSGDRPPIKIFGQSVPWFPQQIADLDVFANKILAAGAELKSDHPGFSDPVYRARRQEFENVAKAYRHGEQIPRMEYTEDEIKTWNTIFTELTELFPTHACREFNDVFPLLEKHCGYSADNIPQLQDISDFLKARTGFTLRPVAGLLSPRDFLAGLAFRVFHSTQYIRHGSKPLYTPEPDICHEVIGHVPLFADPAFAQFSQEIGLASLGAPDDYIEKLSTCYWFTIEFGLCRQNGELKAYGAGLLSSFGELEYCLTDKPEVRDFDPEKAGVQKYPITQYQPIYYAADSFLDAKQKLRTYAEKIPRNFTVHYDPYTQSVDVLDKMNKIAGIVSNVKGELATLEEGLKKYGSFHK